ncbi:hypothetical protein [Microterricola viridarii]|uniref:Uncharacterized protein n=1 Tax=Microterricola viridarii TaxID=412690 RepID=A0A1H1M609_9MICO|nr:hypothetical protein [Microterricola viridarii]SDR82211.1 hypothetical protein SAMN04489834_0320 [Microterricola viridarii]
MSDPAAAAVTPAPGFAAADPDSPTEAEQVASIIAQTSADLTGRPEAVVEAELVARFSSAGLDFSLVEARRVAHDISNAPRLRDTIDD